MTSRRSQRTDDGTPLAIIQEELFEAQRQRRQVALATPPGPPPDMPHYASVNPPNEVASNFANGSVPETYRPPSQQPPREQKQQEQQDKKVKKKTRAPAVVGLQDPMDVPYDPPLVQERLTSGSVRRVRVALIMTMLMFVCLYVYPVVSNVPEEKRLSALTTLAIAVVLGAIGAALWPLSENEQQLRRDGEEAV